MSPLTVFRYWEDCIHRAKYADSTSEFGRTTLTKAPKVLGDVTSSMNTDDPTLSRLFVVETRMSPGRTNRDWSRISASGMCRADPQSTRAFTRNLGPHVEVPMVLWDERLSTAAVERHLIEADASRKRRAEVVDRMAAAYILQGALERLRRLDLR